jgi:hypothetical protein
MGDQVSTTYKKKQNKYFIESIQRQYKYRYENVLFIEYYDQVVFSQLYNLAAAPNN